MLGVVVERVHHAAPVLVDLGCHTVVAVPADAIAGLYAVARVSAHLHGGNDRRGSARSLPFFLCIHTSKYRVHRGRSPVSSEHGPAREYTVHASPEKWGNP